MAENDGGSATAGLCLGIAALVVSFFINIFLGGILAIAGIVVSGIGLSSGKASAKWGMGLSIASLVLCFITYWYATSVLGW